MKNFRFFDGYDVWYQPPNEPEPINDTYPEYYNTDELIFIDVTETRYDEDTYVPYKHMLYRSIEEGNTVEGERIDWNHPMWNFPDII